jgi:ATP-binding cassette subfamily B (MDR/TAP) protein 1
MTYVVGNAFNTFSTFAEIDAPSAQDRHRLRSGISIAALELLALAAGALLLGFITSSLWIWTGEYNVKSLRRRVYRAVTKKDMLWFDLKVGSESNPHHHHDNDDDDDVDDDDQDSDAPLGPGGIMSKFTK